MNYNNWEGRTVKNHYGETYIETKDSEWSHRLQTWKDCLRGGNGKTECPCPMPYGHLMFGKRAGLSD
uniref:Uncharacterized protein n=1 Tax=viral metagenome TaxID=1070528 RepID=A0A6M3LPR7_9ZZZZ